jgi:hypothetical protein
MICWVVLCEVVAEVFSAGSPVDDKLVLLDSITNPVEEHVHRSGFALLEGVVRDAVNGWVVCFHRGWRLGMVEFFKRGSNRDGVLAVDEEVSYFGFAGRCHDVAKFVANGMDGAVGRWICGRRFWQVMGVVESNGCLAVKPKIPKMRYAEAARVSDVVRTQDRLIANGCNPTTSLDRLATTGPDRPKANVVGLVNASDIKKK